MSRSGGSIRSQLRTVGSVHFSTPSKTGVGLSWIANCSKSRIFFGWPSSATCQEFNSRKRSNREYSKTMSLARIVSLISIPATTANCFRSERAFNMRLTCRGFPFRPSATTCETDPLHESCAFNSWVNAVSLLTALRIAAAETAYRSVLSAPLPSYHAPCATGQEQVHAGMRAS